MIVEYHRPNTINEALILLAREHLLSYPLGGGTILNQGMDIDYAVIDLQSLGLEKITRKGNILLVGATVKLQELVKFGGLPADIYEAISHEATYNLRHMATIAGTLVTGNGRSSLATTLLALDASIEVLGMDEKARQIKLGEWLPLRGGSRPGKLITMVSIPMNVHIAFDMIARTPADKPILCVAVTQWKSGRTRLALGGWGTAPILAMDGPKPDGIDIAARNAYSHAADEWASADYRQEMAGVLSLRCLQSILDKPYSSIA